jgi:hypothetical protein
MKRFALILAMGLVALCLNFLTTKKASARPNYKSAFDAATKDSKAADLIKEAKCNVCHFGTKKTDRNDFGKAMNKHIDKDTFTKLKEDKTKLDKKIEEAIKAALKEKSPSGKTFGELIEAGELPAKNP